MRSIGALATSLSSLSCAVAFGQVTMSMTIEALVDVTVEPQKFREQGEKGRLEYYRSTREDGIAVVIKKGQRFRMLKELGEGECRIEVDGNTFDLQSCPWLLGFTHHEEDVYRVIQDGV